MAHSRSMPISNKVCTWECNVKRKLSVLRWQVYFQLKIDEKKLFLYLNSIYIIHMECDGWCVVSVCQKVLMLNTKCTDIFACKKPTNAYPNCYRMDIPFYVIAYSFIFIFHSYAWYIPHIIAYNTNTPRAREENKRIKKTESEYIAMVTRSRWHNDYIGAVYMPKTNDE